MTTQRLANKATHWAMLDSRKQDTRRKIMLGGLVIKSGLALEDDATLLGLMVLAAKTLAGPDGERHRARFRDAGDLAFQNDTKEKGEIT